MQRAFFFGQRANTSRLLDALNYYATRVAEVVARGCSGVVRLPAAGAASFSRAQVRECRRNALRSSAQVQTRSGFVCSSTVASFASCGAYFLPVVAAAATSLVHLCRVAGAISSVARPATGSANGSVRVACEPHPLPSHSTPTTTTTTTTATQRFVLHAIYSVGAAPSLRLV